jgi:hypothetical protein
MVAETIFGTLLVIFAVVIGVGGPLLAAHFQQREAHERTLTEAVIDHASTVEKYREVTQLEPEEVGSPISPEHEVDAVLDSTLSNH